MCIGKLEMNEKGKEELEGMRRSQYCTRTIQIVKYRLLRGTVGGLNIMRV